MSSLENDIMTAQCPSQSCPCPSFQSNTEHHLRLLPPVVCLVEFHHQALCHVTHVTDDLLLTTFLKSFLYNSSRSRSLPGVQCKPILRRCEDRGEKCPAFRCKKNSVDAQFNLNWYFYILHVGTTTKTNKYKYVLYNIIYTYLNCRYHCGSLP